MTIWVVIRCGVYRHEIGGVFSTLDAAKAAAEELQADEPDSWHYYEVLETELDRTARDETPRPRFWFDHGQLAEGAIVYTTERHS